MQKFLKFIFDCNNRSARHFLQNYQKLEKKTFFFFLKILFGCLEPKFWLLSDFLAFPCFVPLF